MRTILATLFGCTILGCGASSDEARIGTVSQKLVWSCYSVGVPLGSSLECSTSSSDGVATASGGVEGTTDRYSGDGFGTVVGGYDGAVFGVNGGTSAGSFPGAGSGERTTGTIGTGTSDSSGGTGQTTGTSPSASSASTASGGTSTGSTGSGSGIAAGSFPSAGSSSTGSGAVGVSGPATTSDGVSGGGATYGILVGPYACNAGTAYCPPSGAKPGIGLIGGDGATYLPGASSASGGGTQAGGGEGDDDDQKTADGEKADKDDAKASSSSTGSGETATSGGTSSDGLAPVYHCVNDGKKRKCTQAIPTCSSGTIPAPGGACVTAGPSAGSATSGPGETVLTSNNKSVGFLGCASNADGTTTCSYQVTEVAGGQDLSNWVLGTNCTVVGGSPKLEVVNPDPNAGLRGVKWGTGSGFSSGTFSVTVRGNVSIGVVSFATKAPGVALAQISGAVCQ